VERRRLGYDMVDLLVEEVVAAVDAVAVDGEQHRHAVSGPGSDLGRIPSGVSHSDNTA
jgi:hypothetical protein